MDFMNHTFSMLHLPGATFLETVGAAIPLTLGYYLGKIIWSALARVVDTILSQARKK